MSKKAKTTMEGESDSKFKFPLVWKQEGNLIYADSGTKPSAKILSFDMDGTLINVKSGGAFAKHKDDWVIWHDKVVPVIKKYYDDGFKIVIMTNQRGIETGQTDVDDLKYKVQNIVEHIGVPILVMMSAGSDHFRKPSLGMWKYLGQHLNEGIAIDLKDSIYCGDAAGRPKVGSKKGDFEDTDYKFALNAGANFKTPEMLFLDAKETLPEFEFNPRSVKKVGSALKGKDNSQIKGKDKEMIIFVGSAGSGKSTFWKTHLSDYVRVNNDTLKSKPKCLKAAEDACKAGKSVVIDNTNPGKDTRAEYISIAKKYGYPVRCFYFDIPKPAAFHLNDLRKFNEHRQHQSGQVAKMVIHGFYKNKDVPDISEGFAAVETVELVAGPFENEGDEEMFYSFVSSKK